MRLPAVLLLALTLTWLDVAPLRAQAISIYEGEAVVASQGDAERAAALPRALAQVLGKVTGDPDAGAAAEFAAVLADAAGMMQQYRYREVVTTAGGVPAMRLFLVARFDQTAVDRRVIEAGRSVWPTPRPRPLLWLAIDDGRGPRLLGEAQMSAAAPLTQRAAERGFTLSFPLADVQDQAVGGAQAVWREELAAVRQAARRYGSEPVLVGKLQRGGALWSAQWILLDGAGEIGRWSAVNAEAGPLLASGADGAATAMARHYAQRIMSGPAGDYEIEVLGMGRGEDYGRVIGHLSSLPIVQQVRPVAARPDRLRLRISLTAGVDGLTRLLQGGGVLRPADGGIESDAAAIYQLEP